MKRAADDRPYKVFVIAKLTDKSKFENNIHKGRMLISVLYALHYFRKFVFQFINKFNISKANDRGISNIQLFHFLCKGLH